MRKQFVQQSCLEGCAAKSYLLQYVAHTLHRGYIDVYVHHHVVVLY